MPRTLALAIALALLSGAGCTSTYRVVQMPERAADMYPLSQTREGLTVAIDEVRAPARAQRYFGANLPRAGILPVVVVVTNHSAHRVVVKPSDVLLHRGREIIDPVPIQSVVAAARDERWRFSRKTRERVQSFFEGVAFKETILLPQDTYQGVLFFAYPQSQRRDDRFFSVWSLFVEGGPRIRVALTDMETAEPKRVHFGPFSLTGMNRGLTSASSETLERF